MWELGWLSMSAHLPLRAARELQPAAGTSSFAPGSSFPASFFLRIGCSPLRLVRARTRTAASCSRSSYNTTERCPRLLSVPDQALLSTVGKLQPVGRHYLLACSDLFATGSSIPCPFLLLLPRACFAPCSSSVSNFLPAYASTGKVARFLKAPAVGDVAV